MVVTGGAGFVGSHLCERLLADRHRVTCLDNLLTGAPANVAHLMEHPAFTFTRCDLTEFVHVPGDVDVVLHFASPASPIDYLRLPIQTLKVGAIGTWHALGLAKEKNARFLLASTSEVYGDPQVHPSPSRTGATSTRWVRAACTTRRNGTQRHSRPPTGTARASNGDRPDLQHLWAEDASGRRPGDSHVHPAGAGR